MKNILYAGLTKKQQKELIELQKQRAIEAAVKEAVEQAVEQAVEKTTAEVKIELIENLIKMKGYTPQEACEIVNLTEEEYFKLLQN